MVDIKLLVPVRLDRSCVGSVARKQSIQGFWSLTTWTELALDVRILNVYRERAAMIRSATKKVDARGDGVEAAIGIAFR